MNLWDSLSNQREEHAKHHVLQITACVALVPTLFATGPVKTKYCRLGRSVLYVVIRSEKSNEVNTFITGRCWICMVNETLLTSYFVRPPSDIPRKTLSGDHQKLAIRALNL